MLVRVRVGGRRGRRPAVAAGRVGVQHLQEEVVHQHHVLPLHGGQMVHAFVTAERRQRGGESRKVELHVTDINVT